MIQATVGLRLEQQLESRGDVVALPRSPSIRFLVQADGHRGSDRQTPTAGAEPRPRPWTAVPPDRAARHRRRRLDAGQQQQSPLISNPEALSADAKDGVGVKVRTTANPLRQHATLVTRSTSSGQAGRHRPSVSRTIRASGCGRPKDRSRRYCWPASGGERRHGSPAVRTTAASAANSRTRPSADEPSADLTSAKQSLRTQLHEHHQRSLEMHGAVAPVCLQFEHRPACGVVCSGSSARTRRSRAS
jgi:hypothetical protein